MNELKIDGNLGRDPKVINTKSDKLMVKCSIAHNEEYNGVKKTMWIPITCFGEAAEHVSKLAKGAKVSLFGKLDLVPSWTKADNTVVPEGLGMVAFKLGDLNEAKKPQEATTSAQSSGDMFEDSIPW